MRTVGRATIDEREGTRPGLVRRSSTNVRHHPPPFSPPRSPVMSGSESDEKQRAERARKEKKQKREADETKVNNILQTQLEKVEERERGLMEQVEALREQLVQAKMTISGNDVTIKFQRESMDPMRHLGGGKDVSRTGGGAVGETDVRADLLLPPRPPCHPPSPSQTRRLSDSRGLSIDSRTRTESSGLEVLGMPHVRPCVFNLADEDRRRPESSPTLVLPFALSRPVLRGSVELDSKPTSSHRHLE